MHATNRRGTVKRKNFATESGKLQYYVVANENGRACITGRCFEIVSSELILREQRKCVNASSAAGENDRPKIVFLSKPTRFRFTAEIGFVDTNHKNDVTRVYRTPIRTLNKIGRRIKRLRRPELWSLGDDNTNRDRIRRISSNQTLTCWKSGTRLERDSAKSNSTGLLGRLLGKLEVVLTRLRVDGSRITRGYLMTGRDPPNGPSLCIESRREKHIMTERTHLTESTLICQKIRRIFLNLFPLTVTVGFIKQFAFPASKQNTNRYKENTSIIVFNDILVISVPIKVTTNMVLVAPRVNLIRKKVKYIETNAGKIFHLRTLVITSSWYY